MKLPKDLTSRRDDVTVKFLDDNGALPETLVGELNFVELPRPAFAFNWQVVDDCDELQRRRRRPARRGRRRCCST